MSRKWKAIGATIGGLICFVITVLSFFEIYAKDVLRAVTAHYIWGIGAILSLSVFAWGIYAWWQNTRITPGNVQTKIREWLDTFNLSHRVHNFEPWYFTYV